MGSVPLNLCISAVNTPLLPGPRKNCQLTPGRERWRLVADINTLLQFKPEDSIVIKVPVSIISPVLSDASSASGQRPYHAFTSQSHIPHQLIGNWGRDGAHLPILASDWSSDGHVTSIVTSDWFRFVIMDCLLSFKTYINGFKIFTRIKAETQARTWDMC